MAHGAVLQLEEFFLETMEPHPRIALIGKSGAGKSWVIRDIMYHLRDIAAGAVIAPTDVLNEFYNDFFPISYIHHEYKDNIIPSVLIRQRKILDKNKKRKKHGRKLLDPRAFFIMDDCMSSKHLWLKDPKMLSIFNEGRHYKLTFMLAMQYSLGIQPELRSNFDYIFLLGEDFTNNKKKLYDHYAGMFKTYDSFEQVFEQVTENFGVMVINNRIRTTDLTKKVFWFKAKPRAKFRIGSKNFNDFHVKYFDKKYDKKVPQYDPGNFSKRNTKPILVKKH